ncbi:MAG: glycine-rich domain-containing protein [Syntrophomonas sp.]
MAKHLYIAGVDRWPDYRRGTIQVNQVLTYQVDNCTMNIKGEKPQGGSEIILEDTSLSDQRLFAGIIVRPEIVRDKAPQVWKIDCQDYTVQMDKRLVVESYDGWAADAIARDIVNKYCPGFSVDGIMSGAPIVESTGTELSYKRPSECMKWLCDYIGWHWYVDYYKVVHFFQPENLSSPAPMSLQPGGKFDDFNVSIDHQGLRNRVYVRGGTMPSDPQTIEWKADGVARQWVLPWAPHDCSLQVAGVSKSIGIDSVDEDATKDYVVNLGEKYIRCCAQTTTPVEGSTISLTGKQDIDVITMVEDLDSQAAIAAIEGGDGVYEHVINDDTLTTIEAAEAAGLADLREWANPKTTGSFTSTVYGWRPGQLVPIELPDRGVNSVFLIQKVGITLSDAGKWLYRIEYGGRLLGIADFLKALVSTQQKKQLNETGIIHKASVLEEQTVEISDELLLTEKEPPYQYADGWEDTYIVPIAPGAPTFSRASVAYKQDGTQVASGNPRYETGRFGNGIMIEEGTTNLFPSAKSESFDSAWVSGTLNGTYFISVKAGTGQLSMTTYNSIREAITASGTWTCPSGVTSIDIFLAGAGGGGCCNSNYACGGGGGYTKTYLNVPVTPGTTYNITVGLGGTGTTLYGNDGGYSRFGNDSTYQANGGNGATTKGGDGGSGGAGYTGSQLAGGTNGADGTDGVYCRNGVGQHTTTREFGETSGTLYASGGNSLYATNGAANTGNGGAGGQNRAGGDGGSGIVVLRQTQTVSLGTCSVGQSTQIIVSNTTVTFTPSGGTPQRSQLELKSYATSWQIGGTARVAETLTIPTAGVFDKGSWAYEKVFIPVDNPVVSGRSGILWQVRIDANNYYELGYNASGYLYLKIVSGGTEYTITDSVALVTSTQYSIMAAGNGYNIRLCKNGTQIGLDTEYVEPMGALPTNMYIASRYDGSYQANSIIDDLRISNRSRTLAEHQSAYNSGQPLPVDEGTAYKLELNGNLDVGYWQTRIYTTVGSLLKIYQPANGLPWPQPKFKTSEDRTNWGEWVDVDPLKGVYEVPYPGYVYFSATSLIRIRNWQKPETESDAMYDFTVAS